MSQSGTYNLQSDSGVGSSAFGAKAATQGNVTGDGTVYTVIFAQAEYFDNGNDFDGVSTFNAPVKGIYQFNCELNMTDVGVSHDQSVMKLSTTKRDYLVSSINPAAARSFDTVGFSLSLLVDMDAADTAVIKIDIQGGAKTVDVRDLSYFNGFLVRAQ